MKGRKLQELSNAYKVMGWKMSLKINCLESLLNFFSRDTSTVNYEHWEYIHNEEAIPGQVEPQNAGWLLPDGGTGCFIGKIQVITYDKPLTKREKMCL
jgi:hypothetical protein